MVLKGRKKRRQVLSLKKMCQAMFCPNKMFPSNVKCSDHRRCSQAMLQVQAKEEEEEAKIGGSEGSEVEDEGVQVFLSKFKTTLTIFVFRTWPNFDV